MNSEMDSLQHYRQRLCDDHEEIRIEAYREIGALGVPDGNEMLLRGLSDRNPLVCAAVRRILTEIADEKIIRMLLELLRMEDPGLRSQAMTVLSQLGHAALRQVSVYLKDADRDVRIFAANIIAAGGLKEAFPALRQALRDPEENVRYAVVEALGRIEVREAIPLLLGILSDEWARYPAIEALGLLKAAEAIPFLLELYDRDEWVRNAVIEALGHIGDAGTVDFLIDRIDVNNEMLLHGTLVSLARIEQKRPTGAFDRLKERGVDVMTTVRSALAVHNPDIRKSALWTVGMIGTEEDLPALIEPLSDPDEEIQAVAKTALIQLGARHIGALVRYPPADERIREELIGIFGEIADREAMPLILAALDDGSDRVRAAAARTLPVFRDASVEGALIGHLQDSYGHVRGACAYSLGELNAVKATRPLIRLLEDEFMDVRDSASWALGKIGTPEIITHVALLLKHERMEVRQAAVQCLGMTADRRAEGYLIEALNNAERGVRRFAANALGARKVLQALRPLMTALMDEDWQVRKSAASALGHLRDPHAIENLMASLMDENIWVRYAAIHALGKIGSDRARTALQRHLLNDATPVRIAAMEALWEINDPDIVSLLIPLCEDTDADVRCAVADILSRCGDKATVAALEKMTDDSSANVRQAAARAVLNPE
jgi:HEAT repeat protein